MPKIEDEYRYKSKKRPKIGKFFKKVFVLLLGCIVLFSTYILADTFSNWITQSEGRSWWEFWKKDVKQAKTVLYAVSLGAYDTEDKAEEIARNSNVAGAGGYVYFKDEKYHVLGNVYKSKEDAQKVLEGISQANYETSIIKLEIPKLKSSFEGATEEDVSLLKEGLSLLDSTFDTLYSVSLKLDTKQMTHIHASTEIQTLSTKWTVLQTKLENQIATHLCNATIIFKTRIVEIERNLDDLADKLLSNTGTIYVVKYATIRHAYLWQSVVGSLA